MLNPLSIMIEKIPFTKLNQHWNDKINTILSLFKTNPPFKSFRHFTTVPFSFTCEKIYYSFFVEEMNDDGGGHNYESIIQNVSNYYKKISNSK